MSRDSSVSSILITVAGTLLMIISAWAGTKIQIHETRIDLLESQFGRLEVLLLEVKGTNAYDHSSILRQLDKLERRLEGGK